MKKAATSFLLMLLVIPSCYSSQSFSISGVVLDAYTSVPVPSAAIYLLPTSEFTFTDINGHFELSFIGENHTYEIAVHRIDYYPLTVMVDQDESMEISLERKPISMETITFHSHPSISTLIQGISGFRLQENLPTDVADVFAETPGFGIIRKGVYGSDPVIRGFKREQLLIQVDGAGYLECACPNRMDPITTQIRPEDLHTIQVVSGPYSLRYGSTLGGMLNLDLDRPQPGSISNGFHASSTLRYESNSHGQNYHLSLQNVTDDYGIRLSGGLKHYENYQDGEGNEVPSEFSVYDYTVLGSMLPGSDIAVDVMFRQSFAQDIDYAGLPMDARKDNATFSQVTVRKNYPRNNIQYFELTGYGSFVDHEMDNHERPNYTMVDAIAATATNTWGGRFETLWTGLPSGVLFLGADADYITKRGSRNRIVYINPCNGQVLDPPAHFTDAVWQHSASLATGIFAEWQNRIFGQSMFSLSTRFDLFHADVDAPAIQFLDTYGDDLENTASAFSMSASLSHQLSERAFLQLSGGYGSRFPSLTELYINHLTVGQDVYEYFGTPDLNPEHNLQMDIALAMENDFFQTRISTYAAYLTDYISAQVDPDMPRLYLPCMEPLFTKRFVNIDEASKYGFEWNIVVQPSRNWEIQTSLAYIRAQDISRDEPLPEIPPFEGRWSIQYMPSFLDHSWVTIQGRHVAEQQRTSTVFGEQETDGYNVFSLIAGFNLTDNVEIVTGVQNLFDEQYREHLNRSYKNQATMSPLYEPGRNVYMQLQIQL